MFMFLIQNRMPLEKLIENINEQIAKCENNSNLIRVLEESKEMLLHYDENEKQHKEKIHDINSKYYGLKMDYDGLQEFSNQNVEIMAKV